MPIRNGIYFTRTFRKTEDCPLVLVHPLFPGSGHSNLLDTCTNEYVTGNYGRNVTDLISQHRGVVVTLETPETLERTQKFLDSLTVYDRFYIKTIDETTSQPLEMKWRDSANFVEKRARRFKNRVKMAGGNLSYHKDEYSGCLGSAYNELVKYGLEPELVNGCCFTHNI